MRRFNHEYAKSKIDGGPYKRTHVAAECGVEHGTLTKYLNGYSSPSRIFVKLLARVIDAPEAKLWRSEQQQDDLGVQLPTVA